jgi:hypothetical protein
LISAPAGQTPTDDLTQSHYTGAASEQLAAAFFLRNGCQIFWPGAQQGATDFVADVNNRLLRVQVKTGYWNGVRGHRYLQAVVTSRSGGKRVHPSTKYDLLVIVHEENLWIIPATEVNTSGLSLEGARHTTRWAKYKRHISDGL